MYKRFKFDHTNKWYMHKPDSVLEKKTNKNSLGYWDTNRSPNTGQKTNTSVYQQEWKKLSENRTKWKVEKYLDLARELE